MKLTLLLLITFNFLTLQTLNCFAQVGINPNGVPPHSSAGLDINFTDKGLLLPRLTTAQRDAIQNPATSLLIYNTTTQCFETYINIWQTIWCACNPPSIPVATIATNIQQTGFTANWTASTGATGYYLDIATDAGFTSFVSGYNNFNAGNVITQNIASLTCNTPYYYRVRVYNACSTTNNSNTVNVLTNSCGTPPCSSNNYQFLFTAGKINEGGTYGYSAVQRTDECKFIMAGQTNQWGSGGVDMMLVGVDPSGTFQWAQTIGGAADDGGGYISNTPNGNYVVGGSTKSWGISGKSSLLCMNFNSSHTIQWSKVIGLSTIDISSTSLSVSNDGGIYIGGEDFSVYQGWLTKLDASGNHQWSKLIGRDTTALTPWNDNYQAGVKATGDNGVVIAGWSWSYRITGAGDRQGIVIKFASDGTLQWAKIIGANGGTAGLDINGISPTQDGGYIICADNGGSYGLMLIKLDANGNLLWAKNAVETGVLPWRITQTSDGGYLIAGCSTVFHPNGKQVRTQYKFDSQGNFQWLKVDNDISDGHPNPWEYDFTPIEVDDGYLTVGFSHRHTDAYAETTMSLQKYTYLGVTCISNAATITMSTITDMAIQDITSRVQTYLTTPAVSTASPAITPVTVTPDHWTDCTQ